MPLPAKSTPIVLCPLQEVGPTGHGPLAGALPAPLRDPLVIAGKKDLGDVGAPKVRRPRVGGRVEADAGKGLALERGGPQRAGPQPNGGVDKRERRNLTAGEHEIAERQLLSFVQRSEPLVDPLVPPADDDEAVEGRQPFGIGLTEGPAGRAGDDDRPAFVGRSPREHPVEDPSDRLRPEHHSGSAAVWAVIGALAGPERVEEVVQNDPHDPALLRSADDREANRRREHLGKERDHVDEEHACMFDIRRLFAAPRRKRATNADIERGIAALEGQQYDEALSRFEAALAADLPRGERALALNKRGVALVAVGRRDEALAAFRDALGSVERYAPALVNIGNLLLEDGDLDGAIERYRAALRADQDYAGAHLNLGVALKRAGRPSEGIQHLRTAQRLEGRRRS
jgi:tetratricopeptide repeat protein